MCNRYSNQLSPTDYRDRFDREGLPIRYRQSMDIPNLEPRPDIRPTNMAPILRLFEDGLELLDCRWGLIPWFYKGSLKDWKVLTTNARRETISTTKSYRRSYSERRCLIPADAYYEWTGIKGHKTKWIFKTKDPWFCFAGIWDSAETTDGPIESFSILTKEASESVKPYHDREPVILKATRYQAWLKFSDLPFQSFDDEDPRIITEAITTHQSKLL